jgi:transposase InsO family protein
LGFGITASMSGTGNCYDNAVMESFFHTLKTEHVYFNHYRSREQAKQSRGCKKIRVNEDSQLKYNFRIGADYEKRENDI